MRAIGQDIIVRFRDAAKTNSGNIHVIPTLHGWSVKREGAKRASSTYSSEIEAIQKAHDYSARGSVIIHKKDGSIQIG